jgi:preprotein translocase subunit YajC
MNSALIISTLPILTIAISIYYILKRPQKARNLSMAMFMPLLGFCVLAYYGTDIPAGENKLFSLTFGILCIYCITMVPALMHLSSAIRQRKKMERTEAQQNVQQQNAQQQ